MHVKVNWKLKNPGEREREREREEVVGSKEKPAASLLAQKAFNFCFLRSIIPTKKDAISLSLSLSLSKLFLLFLSFLILFFQNAGNYELGAGCFNFSRILRAFWTYTYFITLFYTTINNVKCLIIYIYIYCHQKIIFYFYQKNVFFIIILLHMRHV